MRKYIAYISLASLLFMALCVILQSKIIINLTESMPIGFYWKADTPDIIERGQIVLFDIPSNVKSLMYERGYIPDYVSYLQKYVVATAGDVVSITDELRINNELFDTVQKFDDLGRALPVQTGNYQIKQDEIFIASSHPKSFDSRYFGTISTNSVQGILSPIWTW